MKFVSHRDFDVAVIGGGVAGVASAVEAARAGKKVVLVEKSTMLGGLATIGLINFFVAMCSGRGIQICKGMADEFLKLAIKYGYDTIPEVWQNGDPGLDVVKRRYITHFSARIFSLALLELCHDTGVNLMFDTVLTDAETTGGHIDAVSVFNKSGHHRITAKVYVDASGDADLLFMAGVPTVTGRNFHSYFTTALTLDSCKAAAEDGNIFRAFSGVPGGTASLYGKNHPEGKPTWDGTNGDDVTNYFIENQLEVLERIRNDDRMTRDIIRLPVMPQFRTTRRIDGNFTLHVEDVYKHYEDSVCAIPDFDHRYYLFEVPYGVMVRDGFDNVITAGRTTSGEGYAWDVIRVIPPAILTGQAAGAAASQAIDEGCAITDITISRLQEKLASENVIIHFDDGLLPDDLSIEEIVDIGHI